MITLVITVATTRCYHVTAGYGDWATVLVMRSGPPLKTSPFNFLSDDSAFVVYPRVAVTTCYNALDLNASLD